MITLGDYQIKIINESCIKIITASHEIYLDNSTNEDLIIIEKFEVKKWIYHIKLLFQIN